MSLVDELEEFIQSLDEYGVNEVSYSAVDSGRCSETIVIINNKRIELKKVGNKFSLCFNGKSELISSEDYKELHDRFEFANKEMQDVLNSEFYKGLES